MDNQKPPNSNSNSNSNSNPNPNRNDPRTTKSNSNSKANKNKNKNKKVWRTVQVSAGGGPPQGIQMTPEMAAKYIQQAASAAASNGNYAFPTTANGNGNTSSNNSSSSNSNNKKKREVKISFGPSRPTSNSNNHNHNQNQNQNISFAGLDLAALQAAAQAQAQAQAQGKTSASNNNNSNNNNLQCSEAEMKALMGMFVEIMGISMDPEKLKAQGINLSAMMGEMSMSGMNMNMNMMNGMSQAQAQAAANNNNNTATANANTSGTKGGAAAAMKNSATEGFFTDGASWEAIRQTYGVGQDADHDESDTNDDHDDDDIDNDHEEDDSLPDLDHIRSMVEQAQQAAMAAAAAHVPVDHNTQTTTILPVEWNTMVVEEALTMGLTLNATTSTEDPPEESNNNQNNNSKALKKKQKKQQKKHMLKEESAAKAADAAAKKRERSLLSWTSRVVSACHANECGKLQALLQEHPVEKLPPDSVEQHLEFLLPNALPSSKSVQLDQSQHRRGPQGRRLLATYILQTRVGLALSIRPLRNGRTALHTACFYGDVDFLQQVLQRLTLQEQDKRQDWNNNNDEQLLFSQMENNSMNMDSYATYLNQTCQDSGWAPLHYAVVSGCPEILETLLAAGAQVSTKTDETRTWRTSDGEGITPRELALRVQSGTHQQVLESHGTALQEMAHTLSHNNTSGASNTVSSLKQRNANVTRQLERVMARLAFVQANGYSSPSSDNDAATTIQHAAAQGEEDMEQPIPKPKVDNKRQKKKKKKQEAAAKEAEEAANKSSAISVASVPSIPDIKQEQEDPMMTALLGMGFLQEQIYAAAKACGGFHRATADDLVVWILGRGAEDDPMPTEEVDDQKPSAVEDDSAFVVNESTVLKTKVIVQEEQEATLTEEEAKKQQEVEERLKAKREEKRRRNREWNNREQERQLTEAQVKMAQALTRPLGAEFPPGATSDTNLLSPAYPSLETGLPSTLQSGAMPGISTANAAAPVAPLKAPPIATAAATITPTAILKPHREPQLHVGIANKADFPPMHQSSNFPPIQQQSSLLNTSSIPLAYAFPSVVADDDKTVSSLGSNPSRSQSIASNNVSSFASNPIFPAAAATILPPGFRPPSSGPGMKPPPFPHAAFPLGPEVVASDTNSLGEIRATAKAFVPLNFTPAPAAAMSSIPLHGGHQAPLTRPYDNSAALPAEFLMGPAGGPSLLSGARQQSYNRMVPTPLSESSPPALITAPSMTGIPSLGETSSVPTLPSGLGLVDHHHHHGSSLLDSISNNNGGGGGGGGHAAAPMAGSSSLWGGPSSFGGLPPFRFGDADASTGNDNMGIMKESDTGLGWGGFNSNVGDSRNNAPKGQGSIW